MSQIYLGSQSQYRKRVLDEAGIWCVQVPANIDEKAIRHPDPYKLTLLLARAKTQKLMQELPHSGYLICADQVIWWKGSIHEKPVSAQSVRERFSGDMTDPISFVNGVCLTDLTTQKSVEISQATIVYMKQFTTDIIEYIAADPLTYTRAGAFDLQDEAIKPFIERIEGDMSGCVGLPIVPVKQALADLGYKLPS